VVAQVTIIQVTLGRGNFAPAFVVTVVNARHCPPGRITARKPGTSLEFLTNFLASAVLSSTVAHGSRSQALCSVLSRMLRCAAMTEMEMFYGGMGQHAVNVDLFLPFGAVRACCGAALWALCPRRAQIGQPPRINGETGGPAHHLLAVIRQAIRRRFRVSGRTRASALARAHTENANDSMLYLADLLADFLRLLRLAGGIAGFRRKLAAAHESERLRLSHAFFLAISMVVLGLNAGLLLFPQLCG